ncbi:MAG: AMP-binding protein [Mariprofundaceae bacterium]|nr:AMP-binding protein [Mariprofundaceae bacterium]
MKYLLIGLLRWLLKKLYHVEVSGLEHFQNVNPRTLIVANHTSFLDAVLLSVFLPDDVGYAIHSSYYHKVWMRPVKSWIRLFAVDHNDPMAMKSLIRHVKQGNKVVIFPEGRITATGALMKIYAGPGMVADKADADILPIRIDGAQYTPFSHMRGKFHMRWFPHIKMSILPPHHFDFPEDMKGRQRRIKAGKKLAQIMTDMVFETTPYKRRIWDSLLEAKQIHGRDAVVLEDIERKPLSYHHVIFRSFLLGDVLQKSTQEQEHIGILLPNTSACILTLLGLQSRGRIPAMLNYTMGEAAVVGSLETANIETIVTARRFIEQAGLEKLASALSQHAKIIYLEDVKASITIKQSITAWFAASFPSYALKCRIQGVTSTDPALILFTSGSEGVPKGVLLSHENLLANVAQISTRLAMTERDVCLSTLPVFHSFGMTGGVLLPLLSGMRIFLYTSPLHYRVIPEIAYDINATVLFGTNVFLAAYAKHADPYDFYNMRYVVAGAEKLQDETRDLWMKKFGLRILEGYGATETSPVLSVNTPMHYKAGTVGMLLPGIQHRLEPIQGIEKGGRLWVKGANIMMGYLLHDAQGKLEPPHDGWYDTGDIVHIDDDGFLHIQGRMKRFAKVAGEMVSLTAVEEMARHCWSEGMHVALAMNDARKGEQLVLMSTLPEMNRKTLLHYAQANGIHELQVPRQCVSVANIPLLGSGKVDYTAAQALLTSMLADT